MTTQAEKTALVTGVSDDIGAATAQHLAEQGQYVVVADADKAVVDDVATSIVQRGGRAVAVTADLMDNGGPQLAVQQAVDATGRLDVVVHTAGILPAPSTVLDIDDELVDRVWRVHVWSSLECAKAAIGQMRTQTNGGVLLFLSSGGAFSGAQGQLAYASTHAALVSMVKTLALDHARENVRVNCVCRGPVLTSAMRAHLDDAGLAARAQTIPIGRLGAPADVAAAFGYLASDQAAFVTGATLAVDGGLTAGPFRPSKA